MKLARALFGLSFALVGACNATANQAPEVPEAPKTDWHVCTKEGATRRQRCPRHFEQCTLRVAALSLDCYREVWRLHEAEPNVDPAILGPHWSYQKRVRTKAPDGSWWFGQPGDPNYISKDAYADELCRTDFASTPHDHCMDEVIFAIDAVRYGGFGTETP